MLYLVASRKNTYIYPWYLADIVATRDIKKVSPVVLKEAFHIVEKDTIFWYYDRESGHAIGQSLLKKTTEEPLFFKRVIEKIHESSRALTAFCKKVQKIKNISACSNDRLAFLYKSYVDKLITARVWGWVPAFMDGMDENFLSGLVMEKLTFFLKKKGLKSRVGEYYSILSSSEKMSEVRREELARLTMLSQIDNLKNSANIFELIRQKNVDALREKYFFAYKMFVRHAGRFGWLTYAYSGPAMSVKHLLTLLAQNIEDKKSIKQQREDIIDYCHSIKLEKKKIFENLRLPGRLVKLFKISAVLMFMKDYRKGVFQYSYLTMDKVLSEASKRIGITLREIKFLTHDEVIDALSRGQYAPYISLVKKRTKKCCFAVRAGKVRVYAGKMADKMIRQKISKLSEKTRNCLVEKRCLKGMTAYKGKVKGAVKIILVVDDVEKMQDGDILVSSSTNPDLLVAMKKAGAFVTDMGGIISHAAIVARELKKPCVVGVKNATRIFKDGDMVEVDATNGVVRKIK